VQPLPDTTEFEIFNNLLMLILTAGSLRMFGEKTFGIFSFFVETTSLRCSAER
jgi:hypothetical protein